MAGGAASDGDILPLVLQGLIAVRALTGRKHGMGASMTGAAIEAAVACCVPVQDISGIYTRNPGMAVNAFGFIDPGRSGSVLDGIGNVGHAPVAGRAVAILGRVGGTAVAGYCWAGMAVIAGRATGCVGPVNRLGQVFA